jgi:hypothetical protein
VASSRAAPRETPAEIKAVAPAVPPMKARRDHRGVDMLFIATPKNLSFFFSIHHNRQIGTREEGPKRDVTISKEMTGIPMRLG